MQGAFEEMTINEDGREFDVKIVGVKGTGCQKLQEKFRKLGTRIRENQTSEYREGPAAITQNHVRAS